MTLTAKDKAWLSAQHIAVHSCCMCDEAGASLHRNRYLCDGCALIQWELMRERAERSRAHRRKICGWLLAAFWCLLFWGVAWAVWG